MLYTRIGTLSLLLLLAGCIPSPFQQPFYPPQTQTVHMAATPDYAYRHAYRTFTQFGGRVVTENAAIHTLTGEVHNAVRFSITVEPDPGGARVIVRGDVLPNKVVIGEFTEVTDYITLLQRG